MVVMSTQTLLLAHTSNLTLSKPSYGASRMNGLASFRPRTTPSLYDTSCSICHSYIDRVAESPKMLSKATYEFRAADMGASGGLNFARHPDRVSNRSHRCILSKSPTQSKEALQVRNASPPISVPGTLCWSCRAAGALDALAAKEREAEKMEAFAAAARGV